MHRRTILSSTLLIAGVIALSGCATTLARMHSQAEIDSVSRECGLAAGELFQDEIEKRLLFLFRVQPTLQERACVTRWAKQNHLHPVFIDAIDEPLG